MLLPKLLLVQRLNVFKLIFRKHTSLMVNRQPSPRTLHACHLGLLVLSLLLGLTGCLTTRSPRSGYLLTSQNVRGNRIVETSQLESLIPQKPNSRVLGLPITPRLWFYELGQRSYNREAAVRALQVKTNEFEQQSQQLSDDPQALRKLNRRYERQLKRLRIKAEQGNWLMRNLGQPPSYFAERDAQANAAKMQRYLFDKGFFNAQTSYRLDTLLGRQIRVNYRVAERAGYYLRSVTYKIDDPRVDSLVRQSLDRAALKVGDRFDLDAISAERVRIESQLRDQGYYAFTRQYVQFNDVDTIRRATDRLQTDSLHRPVDVSLTILNPPGLTANPVYRIGDVEVRISPDETQPAAFVSRPDTVTRNGVLYLLNGRNLSSRLLNNKILLRPGELYSQTKYRETQRQLFLLNQFKFVNLNFTDTTNRRLQTLVTATPLDKYEATAEGGVTGLIYQSQGFPGGFGSLSFRARNLLGGLETFEITGRYGLEAQTGFLTVPGDIRQVYTSQELGISSSITFPQILFPSQIRSRFNPYNPRTQVSISFNNTLRPDFRRSLLRGTMAYTWQTTPTKQFSFLIADVNLINANFDTYLGKLFKQQLDSLAQLGSTILLSFRRSLSSSFSFAYTYNNSAPGLTAGGLRRPTNFLRTVVESGGTTLNFLPNRFIDTANTNLQFYKFLRFNVDFRHYIPLRNRAMLAFRVNTGVAYGYGPDGGPVPYEKLFFAGGSNSVRAWLPRRLGPGGAYPFRPGSTLPDQTGTGQYIYLFEQPGNVLLEGSAELRGRLFHLGADINGAVFVDAGNVWTLRQNNATRPGSTFQLDTFLPQIAVGTGVGLRIDFSFFVIRLDGGIKVWDPARQNVLTADGTVEDQRFLLPKFSLRQLSSGPNPLVINFGIGYPF